MVAFAGGRPTGRGRPGTGRDYRTSVKAAWATAANPGKADGGSSAAGLLSIATTTKVWPLLLVAR